MKPSEQQIDELIAQLTDWRGDTLANVRKAILAADPEIVEEWKYMGSPVWYRDGMIAVGNAHKVGQADISSRGTAAGSRQAFQRRSGGQCPPRDRFLRG